MKFNLLLTHQRRVRWLWWGLLAYAAGVAGLLGLRFALPFWGGAGFLPLLMGALLFYDKLFRQPGWVLVEADGLTWASPADDAPDRWKWEEIRTYRFGLYRNGSKLFLRLQNGRQTKLDASFSPAYAAMQKAFEQAVRRYNQAHPGAEIRVEKTFFERAIATKILLGLLAAGVAWVAGCLSQGVPPLAYGPVLLGLFLYLALWAAYSGRRE